MFVVACGLCCDYLVNMSPTKSIWGFKFKDMDIYDLFSEKPPPKKHTHLKTTVGISSCNTTAIINSKFQSNKDHLCIAKRLILLRYSVEGMIHFCLTENPYRELG